MVSPASAPRPLSLLAFDTATERMHVGVAVGEQVWLHEGAGGAQASSRLIPTALQLLADAGVALQALDAIAFGRGPGAFTGLRTACSVAQGLALGAGKPVLQIETLLAVAEDAHQRRGCSDLWVAMDARMDEVYGAHYRRVSGHWQELVAPALYTLDALQARWQAQAPLCVAGSAPAAFGARLRCGAAQIVADASPAAAALLSVARALWARGAAVDAALALPLYLRDKVALTIDEREAAKAATAVS